MRNLKRALSLTLASVMLLGMMVVGSSAAAGYDDVADTDNVEAIEVLQAIEVMVGDERGFGPERPVNRAEMAVVMGKLLSLDYNYYSTSCPFNDVYDWAQGWVGACAANGIVSGRGEGVYDPGATVTAVEAASMLMRALGYFKYQNDYADGFEVSTVRQGTIIGIFDGVGSSATEPMTRNQVAQMVLNALQSPVVEPDGNTINLTTPDGTVLTGKVNYVSVTSEKAFARAIGRVGATSIGSTNDGYIVELGERLYDGKLKLTDTTDAFMRPARHWEFDGKDVGTYMKKELLRQEWSVKVTGRMLYDVLTKPTIDDYDFTIAVDGVETVVENKTALGGAFFTKGNLIRANTETVGATGKGVLTQVFVDPNNEEVYIAVINTYLAKATADYNEKRDEATFEVWSLEDKNNSTTNKFLVKNKTEKETLALSGEDFDIEDVKKDDIILVNVAEGEVKVMTDPEVIEKTEIDTFKKNDWVIAEGTQYDYANSIQYDDDVLDDYDLSNMKDTTYRIFLDKYGYAIGVEIVEEADNYVFLTGIDGNTSNLTNKTADGNLIFTDGTMKTAKINMEKSRALVQGFTAKSSSPEEPYKEFSPAALWNTWCTYSVDADGVYTLTQVANGGQQMIADDKGLIRTGSRTTDKVGQGRDVVALPAPDSDYTTIIDKKHISLNGLNGPLGDANTGINGTNSGYSKVYGNDDTVYINVSLKAIGNATTVNPYETVSKYTKNAAIINDVDSVATGVQGVSLNAYTYKKLYTLDNKKYNVTGDTKDDNGMHYSYGVYTLFGDNGYVIAAVVVGEDDGVSSQYAYTFNDSVAQEHWDKTNKEWTWTKNVIIDGEEVTLTEVGDGLSELDSMTKNNWYEVKFKANGNVKSVTLIGTTDADSHGEYVFCKDPTAANHPANGGAKYPKFIGKIELVQQAQVDNTSGKVVLFEDMYTGNTDGNTRGYVLSTEGTSFQVKNATGTLVKGFAVSPSAKTVLVQDKRVIDDDENQLSLALMDSREYFDGGKAGLESAIKKLNLNKAETDKYFRGYVSAVFENGVAQTVIIYERLPNDVNWGTDIDGSNITVGVENGVITVTPATAPGGSVTDAQLIAVRNKLAQLGYTDIKINRSGVSGTVTSIEATKDNITTVFGTVGLNAPAVQSISVATNPTKLVYSVGDTIDMTGAVITADYGTNGHHADAVALADVTVKGDVSGTNTLGATDTKIIVSYGGKTAEIGITMKTLDTISVNTAGLTKALNSYKNGDVFDPTGMVVTANWSDTTTSTVDLADCTFDVTGAGKSKWDATNGKLTLATGDSTATVTVSYGGKTAETGALTVRALYSDSSVSGTAITISLTAGKTGTSTLTLTHEPKNLVATPTAAGSNTGTGNGSVSITGTTLSFTAPDDAVAGDSFTISVAFDKEDGTAGTPASIAVTINA